MKASDLIDTRVMGNERTMYDLFSYLRDNDNDNDNDNGPVPYVESSSLVIS
jgi:hypothetical protein